MRALPRISRKPQETECIYFFSDLSNVVFGSRICGVKKIIVEEGSNKPLSEELRYLLEFPVFDIYPKLIIIRETKLTKMLLKFFTINHFRPIILSLVNVELEDSEIEFKNYLIKHVTTLELAKKIYYPMAKVVRAVLKEYDRLRLKFSIQTTRTRPGMILGMRLFKIMIFDSDLGGSNGQTNVNIFFKSLNGCLQLKELSYKSSHSAGLVFSKKKLKNTIKCELILEDFCHAKIRKLFLFELPRQVEIFECLSNAEAKFMANMVIILFQSVKKLNQKIKNSIY